MASPLVRATFCCVLLACCLFGSSLAQTNSEGSSQPPGRPRCRTSPCIQAFCAPHYALNAIHSNGSCDDVYSSRYCDFCQSCLDDDFADEGSGSICESDYAYFCSFIPPSICSGACLSETCSYCQNIRSQCDLPSNPVPDICSMGSPISQFCSGLRSNPVCNFMTGTPYCEFCSLYDNVCTNIDLSGNVTFPLQVCDFPFLHSACSVLSNHPNCPAAYSRELCSFCDMVNTRCPGFPSPPTLTDMCNSTVRGFCQTFSISSHYCVEGNTRGECSICRLVNAMCPDITIPFFDTCSHESTYLCRSIIDSSCGISSDLCLACQHYLNTCGNNTGDRSVFCLSDVSHVCNSIPTGPSCRALASSVSPGFSIFCSLCEFYVEDCGVMACNDSTLVTMCENAITDLTAQQVLSPQQCSPCNLIVGLCSGIRSRQPPENTTDMSPTDFLRSVVPDPQECRRSPCLQSFCSPTVITRFTNHRCEDLYHPEYCSFCDACEDFSSGAGNGTVNPICMSSMALRCAITTRYLPCYIIYGQEYCTTCKNILDQCPSLNFPGNFFPMEVCEQPILLSGCSVLSGNPNCSLTYGEEPCRFCNMVAARCPPLTNLPTLADLCFNTTFRTFCSALSVPFPYCSQVYTNADCSLCQVVSSMCPSNINFTILDTCSHASVYLCRSLVNSGCEISSQLCMACQHYLQLCPNITGERTEFCYSEVSHMCSSIPSGPACRALVSSASPSFSIFCSLCEFYVEDCGELACNDSNLINFCYETINNLNQRQILSPQQCSPCNLIVGLCSKIRARRGDAPTNSSLTIYESLVPTREECMSSPCLHSFCLPDIITRNFNVSCNNVYSPEYCTFCESCQGPTNVNGTTNASCTSTVARSCAITAKYLPCYAIFDRQYCDSCNQLLEKCPNLNLPENFFPNEVCDQPVLRAMCEVFSNNPQCSSVYNPVLCQFCSAANTRCPPITSLPALTDLCFNSTIHSFCQTLSFPLPHCEDIYNNTACSLCQLFSVMCPLSINITSNILDSCSQLSSYFCQSVVQSACNVSSELCMACQGYLRICSTIPGNRTNFCYSEASQICGNAPTGPACRALTAQTGVSGLQIICSMCDLYVQDCGEIACNDSNNIEMCRNSLANLDQYVPVEQCSPCTLLNGVCPIIRSGEVVVEVSSTSFSLHRSLIPTPDECRRTPCLLAICSPVSLIRHANIPCNSTYHPEFCDFCEACLGISSGSGNGSIIDGSLDLLCTSPVASGCAIASRILPCNSMFGNDYCNFCQGIISQCPNVNISTNVEFPEEICEHPVLRSGCSILNSSSMQQCQGQYPPEACHFCAAFESRCSSSKLPTLLDLCTNETLRDICTTLVSNSLPYCGEAFPSRDCGLCQALNTVCPSNLTMIITQLDTCSQASSYICRAVVQQGCNGLPQQLCMGCQMYLQRCANTTGSRQQFCFSEVSHLCGTVPNGQACRSLLSSVSQGQGLDTICSLCEFYVQDCGEVACNDTSFADMCHSALTDVDQRQILPATQCSPCNLIMGVCPVLRSGRVYEGGSTPFSALLSLIPTPEECRSSPCLQSFCSPVTFSRLYNMPCDSVYLPEYCQFCQSCQENSTFIDPLCTTPIASSCAIATNLLTCKDLFDEQYCNFCSGVVSECRIMNFTRSDGYLPREICEHPVVRSACDIFNSHSNCSGVYPREACQFCSVFQTQCPTGTPLPTLADFCSNETLRGYCQKLVSTSLPYCAEAYPTQDCSICQLIDTVCPTNLDEILSDFDTCSHPSTLVCRAVIQSGCTTLPPQLCMACQGYVQRCANESWNRTEFCFSEVSQICGSVPTGDACRSLVSSVNPALGVVCSLCDAYVEDCGEITCDDSRISDMCQSALTNIDQRLTLSAMQCSPCNFIMGLCPVLRSGRVIDGGSTPFSALRSLIPSSEECSQSPCLQSFCSPVFFNRLANISCDSVYDPEFCSYCESCQANSTILDLLCTTPIATGCAVTTTDFPCREVFDDNYCNFCENVVNDCRNVNISRSDTYLPREICEHPVVRSACDIFNSHSNCSGVYPREMCQFCTVFEAQCPVNTTLPTIADFCSNETLRDYCQKLVSTSLPYCGEAYPTQDCSLCQLVSSVCPSNLASILSDFNTCSQPSTYLCRAVMNSDCSTYTPQLCMACQGYVQRCDSQTWNRTEFCFSDVSHICALVPSGSACRAITDSVSSGLSIFCSLCEVYASDCGDIACNQSNIVNMCFDTITNVSTRQTSSPQLCSPCNLIVRLCSRIRPELTSSIPSFPQSLIPTAQECMSSPCLQSFCLPTTFTRHFNIPCENTYNQEYCSFCDSCQGFSSGDGIDPRCTSPIASACSITARYLPCYATFGAEYCDSCRNLLQTCPNLTYPDNFFPTEVCGQPLLRSACSVFADTPTENCSAQFPREACEFCNKVTTMCPPVSTLPSISELCRNETMRDFCRTLSISFPHCSEVYTNPDCSLCQLLNSVCPSNITMFDTCIPESVYLCKSIVQAGCHLSSELCMACRHYVQMCPNMTGNRNQFCQSHITNICGSIPTATVCTALAVNVPEVRIFCSFCQFYVQDCGQIACNDQDLVNFCFESINDINSRQLLSPQQCSPCNLIVGLCPMGSRNSSLLHPNTIMPTPEECNASPCLQSFCTPTVITHQVGLPCENFYHSDYCTFCESCLGIGSGSGGVDPSCISPLATSCAINARYLPCFTLFGSDYCDNCRGLLDRCPNLNLPNTFFPQEVCGQPLLHSGCSLLSNNTNCASTYAQEACQFCDVVSDRCPAGAVFPSISDLCFNNTLRGFCQSLSISFPLCAQAYSNADCSLCELINRQCPRPPTDGNCTSDYAGIFCRLIGRDMSSCLQRFTPQTCQSCAAVAERCGTLETASLTNDQLVSLCAIRSTCSFFPLNCGHQAEIICDYCNFLRDNQGSLTCPTGPLLPSSTIPRLLPSSTIPLPSSSSVAASTPAVQRPMLTSTDIPTPSNTPTLPVSTMCCLSHTHTHTHTHCHSGNSQFCFIYCGCMICLTT